MAAIVRTYPQQTGSVTMLQTRPSHTSSMMPSGQGQPNNPYMAGSQTPRSAYHGSSSPSGYRGGSASGQQYGYTSTPNLNQSMPWQQQQQQQQQYGGYRANSSPAVPAAQGYDANTNYRARASHNAPPTHIAHMHQNQMGMGQSGSRDDFAIPAARNHATTSRPHSAYMAGSSPAGTISGTTTKAVPDRYRRPSAQSNQNARSQSSNPSSAGTMGNAGPIYNGSNSPRAVQPTRPSSGHAAVPGISLDGSNSPRQSSPDEVSRIEQRNMHAIASAEFNNTWAQETGKKEDFSLADTLTLGPSGDKSSKTARVTSNNSTPHSRNGSSESVSSIRSSHSRPSSATNRNVSVPTGDPSLTASNDALAAKQDTVKLVNIPARGSSSDATKRTLNPSPLSKPATMANESSSSTAPDARSYAAVAANLDTPAAKQLAALNQKGGRGKNKTSRLRRAFSFGSAAELRKAAGTEDDNAAIREPTAKGEPARLHKDRTPEEAYNAEQARIAEAQEAAGIGNNIYGGRFSGFGSTDNLSISSTASSASIMLRKMGRGMKKSTRSLAGLFRPKSVVGVPAAEPLTLEASEAAVSMITVEAETQRVNVTPDPHSAAGGTGFPRLERNSIETARVPEMMVTERLGSSGTDTSNPRKSIVGGDKERAEVLAAVRKGILKRSTSPAQSPAKRHADMSPELDLPAIPIMTESPNSSAPSTPNDEAHGHKRTGSIAVGNDDYFMAALRLRQDTKSAPTTPQGTHKRNATFSPRIIFHDTWTGQEYDRRGEIATCNRLTPMLAQQIKEELNTFKMEMEVHENSKVYTHFF